MAHPIRIMAFLAAAAGPPMPMLAAQGLEGEALQKALNDKAADFWIYDDLDAGYKAARESGKPLLVSFRCVP